MQNSVRAKLVFNPSAGKPADAAARLVELLSQLQAQQIQSEVILVQPGLALDAVARNAVRAGTKMVIVSGGDGTIENVARGLVGSRTTLGIIPTGTRNNLARSLSIPTNSIADAVALLRNGRRLKLDVGYVRHRKGGHSFLEAGAIGLVSALFPSADDVQHGDLGKMAEFISTFVSAVPSEIRLRLNDRRQEIVTQAHMVIVANTPFMGANFRLASDVLFDDRQLDVLVYSDLSKRDLIGQAIRSNSDLPDARIQRFRARKIAITTKPAMPVMADGVFVGNGSVTVTLHPRRLSVMAGLAVVHKTVEPTA